MSKETPQQITERINALSRYLASAQQVVDNYKNQISELEAKRSELLDAGYVVPSGVAIPCRYE